MAPPLPPLQGRSLPLPHGTLWLDEGVVELVDERRSLPELQLRFLGVLADGGWHDDEEVLAALGRTGARPGTLHSLAARLRRSLGRCVERRYGGGWRLRTTGPVSSPELVALLDTEQATSTERLCELLRCTRPALRTRIHRLRREGYPILHEPGGYRLEDDDGVSVQLHRALETHPLVVLWGPVGVGTTHLAERQGGRLVRIQGMPVATARRRLTALVASPPGRLWIDGAGDPRRFQAALQALVEGGHRLLVTARCPLASASIDVAHPPWPASRLRRTFPGRDVEGFDGLPFAALPDDTQRRHVLDSAQSVPTALLDQVAQGSALQGEALALARAQGWLVHEPPRVALPVLTVLRSRWSAEQWVERGKALASTILERHLADQSGGTTAPLRTEAVALLHALQQRGLPSHGLASAAFHAGLWADDGALRRAHETCTDGNARADLSYARWLLSPAADHDLLRQAIDEASTEATAHELQVELAYALWTVDRQASLDCFRDTREWLATQAPEEHMWVRSEWMASRVLREPTSVAIDELIDGIAHVERVSLIGGEPKARYAWLQLRWALGVAALARDQLGLARRSLEVIVSVRGDKSVRYGAIDLLFAYVRAGAWSEAEALWPMLRDADLVPAWDAHRLLARGLWLLAQGQIDAARDVTRRVPKDRPSGILHALLAALDGELTPYGPRPDVSRAVVEVVRGVRDLSALDDLPSCRFLSAGLVRQIVGLHPRKTQRDDIDDICNSQAR